MVQLSQFWAVPNAAAGLSTTTCHTRQPPARTRVALQMEGVVQAQQVLKHVQADAAGGALRRQKRQAVTERRGLVLLCYATPGTHLWQYRRHAQQQGGHAGDASMHTCCNGIQMRSRRFPRKPMPPLPLVPWRRDPKESQVGGQGSERGLWQHWQIPANIDWGRNNNAFAPPFQLSGQ